MSRRIIEILVMASILAVTLMIYIGRRNDWFGIIELSTGASIVVILLLTAGLGWVMVRTIQGHPAERRMVFLFIGIAITVPFFMSLTQKMSVSPETTELMNGLEALPPGSRVLVTFDYDPASAPELQPMAESFFRYAFDHRFKVIIMGLWPQGPTQANQALAVVLADEKYKAMNLQYGIDYVNLGFQSGNEFVIQRIGSDFQSMFRVDFSGTPYDQIPLVKNIKNFSNIDYSFNLSAGYPGTREWVLIAVDRYGLKMGAGNTAVQTTGMYPYVRSGQLIGILGGMNGAAEFEEATGYLGKGTRFMLSQSFAHMIIIVFILIGNVAYFMHERKRK
ncbi:MAG: hypothetical protein IPH75_02410 [bacterium]|nr:hypothetical protein [bacterium]